MAYIGRRNEALSKDGVGGPRGAALLHLPEGVGKQRRKQDRHVELSKTTKSEEESRGTDHDGQAAIVLATRESSDSLERPRKIMRERETERESEREREI